MQREELLGEMIMPRARELQNAMQMPGNTLGKFIKNKN